MAPPETPRLTTDAVVFHEGRLLLVRRANEPWKGAWALPGGFVDVGETTAHACLRELREETGVEGEIVDLLDVYDDPDRDPRGHVVSVVYVVRADAGASEGRGAPALRAGDDAAEAKWFELDALPEEYASDHADVVADALDWLEAGGDEILEGEDEDED